jgi:EGF-domain serine glucosyl/xylosyltransferase
MERLIVSFNKDAEYYDILYPNWAFWDGGPVVKGVYPRSLGRWDEQIKNILA